MDIWKYMTQTPEYLPTDNSQMAEGEPEIPQDEGVQAEPEAPQEPYNPFISEAFKAPEAFESPEEEREWYRNKFNELQGTLTKKEFYETLFDSYRDQFLSKEEESKQILETYKALKTNPREYIRQHFPESLAEIGISPVMKDEEVADAVDKRLQQEFGEDYKNLYNTEDLAPFKGNTLTRQIFNRGNELHAEFQKQNEKSKQIFSEYTAKVAQGQKPIDDSAVSDYIDKEYSKLEQHGVSREDYDAFISELKDFYPTVEDFWKMKNVNSLVEKARKEAYEEGKKAAFGGISKIASSVKPEAAPKNSTSEKAYEDWTKAQLKKGMGFSINY
jgi:hypothetical protein